jgi:hypothetical protein
VGDNGSLTVDLRNVLIAPDADLRLDFVVKRGNMRLVLPDDGLIFREKIQIDSGNLTLVVNESRTIRLALTERTEIAFSPENFQARYVRPPLEDFTYQTDGVQGDNFSVDLTIDVDGTLTLEHIADESSTPPNE